MSLTIQDSPLGQSSAYVSSYTPALLFPIARSQSRLHLNLTDTALPFHGNDLWTGYELSWLDKGGKPQVAIAEFSIPAHSPNIIESKSFKLYLNSFNQTVCESREKLAEWLVRDLSQAAGAGVGVKLFTLDAFSEKGLQKLEGRLLDDLELEVSTYHPAPALLTTMEAQVTNEQLYSHLLKTNCPVTGQPDWASIQIQYSGQAIDPAGLLAYIISFREHQDFHEHCVERIFCDIIEHCKPQSLSVYARYTRRGGLDINPYRSTEAVVAPSLRLVRQ
jgi:7-cyano-7-deazaguanine reductase